MFTQNPVPPHQRQPDTPDPKKESLDWGDVDQEINDDGPVSLAKRMAAAPEPLPPQKLTTEEVDVPWFLMKELPSQFRPYPAGTTVSYRPYTFAEIETVSEGRFNEIERFMHILEGITATGIDVLDLTMGDFICIAMYRKFATMGTEEVQLTFVVDDAEHHHVMRASELSFDELTVELPIILDTEVGGRMQSIEFMPVTLRQHLAYLNVPEEVRKGINQAHAWLALGSDQDLEPMLKLVADATGERMMMLTAIDTMLYHGISDLIIPLKEKSLNQDWVKMETEKEEGQKNFYPQYIERVIKNVRVEVKEDSMLVTPFRGATPTSKNGLRFGRRGNS
ncbi:hypothetical protein Peetri_00130 [Pseudomonas phage vB_PpuM-Peetri]